MNVLGNEITASILELRHVLESSNVIGSLYLLSASVCVTKTSATVLASRYELNKKKHFMSRKDTADTRLRNVEKEMIVHAKALYEAWAAIPALHNKYLAIIAGQANKRYEADAREAKMMRRVERKHRHAEEDRADALIELHRRLRAEEDLGDVGGLEDLADAQAEKAYAQAEKAYAQAEKEDAQTAKDVDKINRQRNQLRHQIFANFPPDLAISLLMMVDIVPPNVFFFFFKTDTNLLTKE